MLTIRTIHPTRDEKRDRCLNKPLKSRDVIHTVVQTTRALRCARQSANDEEGHAGKSESPFPERGQKTAALVCEAR